MQTNQRAGKRALLMVVLLLFSSAYVLLEAGHDCTGEDCPICVVFLTLEANLRALWLAAVLCALFAGLLRSTCKTGFCIRRAVLPFTPVSLHVKLSD